MRTWRVLATLGFAFACGGATVAVSEGGADGGVTNDGAIESQPPDAAPDAAPVYSDFNDPTQWSAGPTDWIPGTDGGLYRAAGGAFDGRYVYEISFVLGPHLTKLQRYDTTLPFSEAASWDSVPIPQGDAGTTSFIGLVVASGYVYAFPSYSGYGDAPALTRFKTSADLRDPAAFERHVLGTLTLKTNGLAAGGVFDGRYVYFDDALAGQLARYDTTAPFDAPSSYEHSACAPSPDAYTRWSYGSFDGRFVYFVKRDANGSVLKYDTTQPFSTGCDIFPMGQSGLVAPETVVFDGVHVYVANEGLLPPFAVAVARHDWTLPIHNFSSWVAVQLPKVSPRLGATFDGRYVYFAGSGFYRGNPDLVRYDTTRDFVDPSSWQQLKLPDVVSVTSNRTCEGLVFDGEYVYCVGAHYRFHARTPRTPLGFQPAFY